ncbi:MAG: hypothetical protein PVI54_00135 [Desulfobacteraceae bacterium]|jgi:hypothetical protein
MMPLKHCNLIALIVCGLIFAPGSQADEVVMTTGERFSSSKVWQENGKIRFKMHGLVVSVNKADVAQIIGGDGSTQSDVSSGPMHKPRRQMRQAPSSKPKAAPIARSPAPPPPTPPKEIGPHQSSKTNVRGIGFNGISWHMRPTDLPGLAKIKTEPAYGGIDQYWRPDGAMTLGEVLLDGLVFGFWQNRLYSIMMWVEGRPAYNGLERVVLDRYGDGRKSKTHQARYVWVDDRTTDRMLEFDEQRNVGIFWMRSRDLDSHIKSVYPES